MPSSLNNLVQMKVRNMNFKKCFNNFLSEKIVTTSRSFKKIIYLRYLFHICLKFSIVQQQQDSVWATEKNICSSFLTYQKETFWWSWCSIRCYFQRNYIFISQQKFEVCKFFVTRKGKHGEIPSSELLSLLLVMALYLDEIIMLARNSVKKIFFDHLMIILIL